MSNPFDPNNKTCKEKGCIRLYGNHCHARDNGKFLLWGGREYPDCEFFEARKMPTVFETITASPEVLAVEFVGMMYDRVSGEDRYYSMLTGDFYNSYEEAIAATVARLKEMCDEEIR